MLVAGMFACLAAADESGEDPPAAPRWHFRNGSRIGGRAAIEAVTVDTRYGTLKIPLTDVVSVRFAPRLSRAERDEVGAALRKLAADSAAEREEASETLRSIGPASLPALRAAVRASRPPLAERVERLYAEILADALGPAQTDGVLPPLVGLDEDEIVTRRFRVRGFVCEESFELLSPYGKLEIDRADLTAITFDAGRAGRAEIDVDAARVVPDNWLRTEIEVSRGDRLSIVATGQLNQQNYGIVCGPEGTTRYSGSTVDGLPMLSLVGKIGRGGKPFLIGAKLRDRASQSGQLYLGIVPFRRNYAAQGTFEVKVSVAP